MSRRRSLKAPVVLGAALAALGLGAGLMLSSSSVGPPKKQKKKPSKPSTSGNGGGGPPASTATAKQNMGRVYSDTNDSYQSAAAELDGDAYDLEFRCNAWRAAEPGRQTEFRDGSRGELVTITLSSYRAVPARQSIQLQALIDNGPDRPLIGPTPKVLASASLSRNNYLVTPIPPASKGPYNCARGISPPIDPIKYAACGLHWTDREDVYISCVTVPGADLVKVVWPWGFVTIGPFAEWESVWVEAHRMVESIHVDGKTHAYR